MRSGVVAIGEVMVEFAPAADSNTFQLGFAGDTFNTAVGLARLGVPVTYATLLGDDPFSDRVLQLLRDEGISDAAIERLTGRQPGLYIISNDAAGERSFSYWRNEAPARELWLHESLTQSLERQLMGFACIYLSGITLAIMQQEARERLKAFLQVYRQQGGRVAFDSNFRPRLWADISVARQVVEDFLQVTDVALLTLEDEQMLWQEPSPEAIIKRHRQHAISELLVKRGSDPVILCEEGQLRYIEVPAVADILDTTGAGDAFNAGYLAGRLQGKSAAAAVEQGNRAAAAVIQQRGGIVSRDYFIRSMQAG